MTTATTPTTELEAVNTMLSCIEEAPVVSLDDTGLVDVATARAVLSEVSRAVQKSGWKFNREADYPLVRDIDGNIPVPANVMKLKAAEEYRDRKITTRGTRLYDLKNHTYVFTEDLKVDVVFLLSFEELPEAARHYITVRAARVFQTRVLGSETLQKFHEDDEGMALIDLNEAEGDTGDYNIFTGTLQAHRIAYRHF